jgi:hypothetical protein
MTDLASMVREQVLQKVREAKVVFVVERWIRWHAHCCGKTMVLGSL